jgi:hypothetical protein
MHEKAKGTRVNGGGLHGMERVVLSFLRRFKKS